MAAMKTAAEKRPSPAVWIATVAGAGYFPVAPGTVGSAVGVGLVAALGAIRLAPAARVALVALAAAVLFAVGVWSAGRCEEYFGRTDPGHVVIDEVVGQMVTLLLAAQASWQMLLAGFVLFRIFDVAKPYPVCRAERLPAGWGIMVDDVLAGAYALMALALIGHMIR